MTAGFKKFRWFMPFPLLYKYLSDGVGIPEGGNAGVIGDR